MATIRAGQHLKTSWINYIRILWLFVLLIEGIKCSIIPPQEQQEQDIQQQSSIGSIRPMAGVRPFSLHESGVEGSPVYDPGDEDLSSLANPDYIDSNNLDMEMIDNKIDLLRRLEEDIKEEQEVVTKSAILMKLLEDPNLNTLPVVYVEEQPSSMNDIENSNNNDLFLPLGLEKRSRYYRRYPWKRHSSRNRGYKHRTSTYEPDARYLCVPSKEDVFKLLVGLHENRKGNHQKTVNFCNRKRPAKAIFTNIRFLG